METPQPGRRWWALLAPAIGLVVFGAMLWVLHRQLIRAHPSAVWAELRSLPASRLAWSLLLTSAGYLMLTGYDLLGLRYVGRQLGVGRVMFASFLSYVFSNNVGWSVVGASAVRFRLYTAWGVSAGEIVKLVAFVCATFWLGIGTLAGLMFLVAPPPLPPTWPVPDGTLRAVGLLLLAAVTTYLLMCRWFRRSVRFREWEFELPTLPLGLGQALVGALDWTLAAGALYVLLPEPRIPFGVLLSAYLLAQFCALVSHVPGGIGVFEALMLWALSDRVPPQSLLGCLLAYRAIYYLLPFGLGAMLMGGYEVWAHRHFVGRVGQEYERRVGTLIPHFMAVMVFLAGVGLLCDAATPEMADRLDQLGALLPLSAIEISHFLASLVGVVLLFLALGLHRRLDTAYPLTLALLAAGIVLLLLKGLHVEEAAVLAVMLAVLAPCRRQFYRRSSLLAEPLTPGWIAAVLIVVLGTAWLGLVFHRHADADELWWRFAPNADAPRFLRSMVGIVALMVGFGLFKLLRPSRMPRPAVTAEVAARVAELVRQSPKTHACLALLGDKQFLLNPAGTGFIMYGVHGRTWVALGDPLGPPECQEELAWQFRELCDQHAARPVFYQVEAEHLPVYVDLGLALFKLGEEAHVALPGFDLAGGVRKDLRHEVSRAQRAGCRFELIPKARVPELLPACRVVSDAWLKQKHVKEKGFSLGCFDERYLRQFPLAVVWVHDRLVAFANVWEGAGKAELSLDLMRHVPDAPNGVMTFLFCELMRWGQAQGYASFSLGMAPLSGLQDRTLAPVWHRLGAWVYRHGEHFYDFAGLRQFKSKFDPTWTPKYLASPGGLALPLLVGDIVTLIGRGQHPADRPRRERRKRRGRA